MGAGGPGKLPEEKEGRAECRRRGAEEVVGGTVKVHMDSATICATVGIVLRPTRRLSLYHTITCTYNPQIQ